MHAPKPEIDRLLPISPGLLYGAIGLFLNYGN
jgi:hypothetical protein